MAIDPIIPLLQGQVGQEHQPNPLMQAAINRLGIRPGVHETPLPYTGPPATPDLTPIHGGTPESFGYGGELAPLTPPVANNIGQYLPRRPQPPFPTHGLVDRGIPQNETVDPLVLAAQRRINYGY